MALSNNMCRCCMIENTDQSIEMLSIFSKLENDKNIKEMLKEAIPRIKIPIGDKLPKKICSNCLEAVKEIYQFQQNCVKNEAKFHEMLVMKKETTPMVTVTTFDYIDSAAPPIVVPAAVMVDEFVCENPSPGSEDLKLNIDKIEMELNSEVDDFVESCSDFSLDMPASNGSDTDYDGGARKKKTLTKKRQKVAIESKKIKEEVNPNDVVYSIKHEPTNDQNDINDFATDIEEIVESDFSLDLSMCDEDLKFQPKNRKQNKKSAQAVFSCEKCEKTFRFQTALDKHMDAHRKLVCNICEEGRQMTRFQQYNKII